MKVMLDLNVLLDYFQKREPHYQHSSIVLSEVLKGNFAGVAPAHALTTIYYISAKHATRERANEIIDWLLAHLEIASADKSAFARARDLQSSDFEDAVVASLAEASQCDLIITRNVSDFANSPIAAMTPEEFVNRYVSQDN
ncbi:MAG: PIN domain-containing protein [bacterium]